MATSLSNHLLYIHSYSRHYNHLQAAAAAAASSSHPFSFFNFVSVKRNRKFCCRSRLLAKSKTPKSSTPSPLSSSSSSSSSSDFQLPPLLRFRYCLVFCVGDYMLYHLCFLIDLQFGWKLQRCTEFGWAWSGYVVDCIACSFGFSCWSHHISCWYCFCWSSRYSYLFIYSYMFIAKV